jgi:GLPGLI family protein
MKKSILFIFLMLPVSLFAETKDSIDVSRFAVVYDYQCHTVDKNGVAVTDSFRLAVLVGTHITKCAEYNGVMIDDFGEVGKKEFQYGEFYAQQYNVPIIYMNYPEGQFSAFDKVVPQRYLVKGELKPIDWTLTEDTMTIGGYLCYKAMGKYAGRTWTAWYTEDIPMSAGPWKLCGLPGMILKAVDAENIHSFCFSGLINRTSVVRYEVAINYQPISSMKFIKYRNRVLCNKRYAFNPRYYIPDGVLKGAHEIWAGGAEPAEKDKFTMLGWDMLVPKTAHVYQPLEK